MSSSPPSSLALIPSLLSPHPLPPLSPSSPPSSLLIPSPSLALTPPLSPSSQYRPDSRVEPGPPTADAASELPGEHDCSVSVCQLVSTSGSVYVVTWMSHDITWSFRYVNVLLRKTSSANNIWYSPARKCFLSKSTNAFKAEEYSDITGVCMRACVCTCVCV